MTAGADLLGDGALVFLDAATDAVIVFRRVTPFERQLDVGLVHGEVHIDLEFIRDELDAFFSERGGEL